MAPTIYNQQTPQGHSKAAYDHSFHLREAAERVSLEARYLQTAAHRYESEKQEIGIMYYVYVKKTLFLLL